MNNPCQHFEMNEAWILSGAGGELPGDPGESGTVKEYQEKYPGGAVKATWGAKICDDGRYLLHGKERWYYENGVMEYEASYYNGRKVGAETYWDRNGVKLWSWRHDKNNDLSVWTQWWANGLKRVESEWRYGGKVANGTAYHWDRSGRPVAAYYFVDGEYMGETDLPEPQVEVTGDLNFDYVVDLQDVVIFGRDWLLSDYNAVSVEPDANGLILWYKFDETSGDTVYDWSGNDYDGTAESVEGADWDANGYDGGCLSFNNDTRVAVPSEALSGVDEGITISVWLKGGNATGRYNVVFETGEGMYFLRAAVPNNRGDVYWRAGDGSVEVLMWSDSYPIDWRGYWNHYAFVKDAEAGVMKIYHNGSLAAEKEGTFGSLTGIRDTAFVIGSLIRDAGDYIGKMDDFKVYNYALSPGEIVSLATGGTGIFELNSPPTDLYKDDNRRVNLKDYAVLTERWLK